MSKEEPKFDLFFNSEKSLELPPEKENQNVKETQEYNDVLSYDKKFWNLNMNELQFPDISLKKESESKLSIDNNNDKLKEYLNEDLLNALEVSPMNTPKNIYKDPLHDDNLNNINDNNIENIINNTEDMHYENDQDLFQFNLYNNNDKNEEIDDNNQIKINDNNIEDFNKINIIEDPGGGNINNIDNNILEKEIEKQIENTINNINISPTKENKEIKENEEKQNEKKEETPISIKKEEPIINQENKEIKENKEKEDNTKKKSYQPNNNQYQQYAASYIQFPYIAQPLMKVIQSSPYGHENKFDGNKQYKVLVPFTVLKKNIKMKKPFEIRDGDWTCSNCNNLNFSFRTKCNRCNITKEQSEQNKQNKTNKNNENIEPKINYQNQNKKPNYNMMSYNANNYIIQNPIYNQGKYYPGYIYIPIQGNFIKKYQKGEKDKKNEN